MVRQHSIKGEQLIPGKGGTALVVSKSVEGVWHFTTTTTCDCLSFTHRGTCRHLRAVRSYYTCDEAVAAWATLVRIQVIACTSSFKKASRMLSYCR